MNDPRDFLRIRRLPKFHLFQCTFLFLTRN